LSLDTKNPRENRTKEKEEMRRIAMLVYLENYVRKTLDKKGLPNFSNDAKFLFHTINSILSVNEEPIVTPKEIELMADAMTKVTDMITRISKI
jgi:hypothetical protein